MDTLLRCSGRVENQTDGRTQKTTVFTSPVVTIICVNVRFQTKLNS